MLIDDSQEFERLAWVEIEFHLLIPRLSVVCWNEPIFFSFQHAPFLVPPRRYFSFYRSAVECSGDAPRQELHGGQ
jgi:hypothetical protein